MKIFDEIGVRSGKDRVNEEVIYNIFKAQSLMEAFAAKFLASYNLSPAKFNLLLMVKHVGKEGGLSQNDISKLLLVTTSNITHMIDRLEKAEYVVRQPQSNDRRVKKIKITKKGSDLLNAIWPHYKEKIDSIVKTSLTNKDKADVNRILEKFNTYMKTGIK